NIKGSVTRSRDNYLENRRWELREREFLKNPAPRILGLESSPDIRAEFRMRKLGERSPPTLRRPPAEIKDMKSTNAERPGASLRRAFRLICLGHL
ncbi:hypothetical protein ACSVJI_34095, partial [Pseudomonas aeruginosa]|uniref:hypothetical protein n=1 Tax=Pseudomonas aeruginosa TaxID=287 RepID=UPI003F3188C7